MRTVLAEMPKPRTLKNMFVNDEGKVEWELEDGGRRRGGGGEEECAKPISDNS